MTGSALKRTVVHRTILILACLSLNNPWAVAQPLNDYKRALVEHYGAVGFHPLLLPQEHRVGDVIDIQSLQVVREKEECFPALRTERSSGNVSLPFVMQLENTAASFWTTLKHVLGIETGADDTRQVLINLEDVSVDSASISALRAALADVCSDLLPLFETNQMPTVMGRRVNVIAGILRARVHTVFSYSSGVQAEARLENLANWLGDAAAATRLRELSPELAATFGLSQRVNIIEETELAQTVAYRPATIFRPRLGASATGDIEVEPFDPENAVHRERLRLLASAWADSPASR